MARGKPGADSFGPVTTQVAGTGLIALAEAHFGETPVFWGRYFSGTPAGGGAEYRHLRENQALRNKNIRLLPVARQTRRVSGTQADGSFDAQANAADLFATFDVSYLASLHNELFMFLDVEGAPSLSEAYYAGWAQTLSAYSKSVSGGQLTIVPCVYATRSDNRTWTAVGAAVASGSRCGGAWVARWSAGGCQPMPDWTDQSVRPAVPLSFPVLIWQYANDCYGAQGFDCSETNPGINLQNDLLNHLIVVPAN